jgi:hypothetical protein
MKIIEKFLSKFPYSGQTYTMDPSVIDKYKDIVPSLLVDIWNEY